MSRNLRPFLLYKMIKHSKTPGIWRVALLYLRLLESYGQELAWLGKVNNLETHVNSATY